MPTRDYCALIKSTNILPSCKRWFQWNQ